MSPPRPPQFLSDLNFADTNTANVATGDDSIDKRDYPSSVWLCSDLELLANINCDSSKTPYWVDYNVPAGYQHFQAVIGFSATSPSDCEASVQLSGDGAPLYAREIVYGDSIPLRRTVGNYLRLRLQIDPKQGRGICNVVFGNAEFSK